MNLFKEKPLIVGSIVPFILFILIYSLSHLMDGRTYSYAQTVEEVPESSVTSGTNMPRESFVRFEQTFVDSISRKETVMGLGSGVVIKTTDIGSYILTNNHVCHISFQLIIRMAKEGRVGSVKNMVKSLDGERSEALILKRDPLTDMCVVFARNFFRPAVKMASEPPVVGESIYIVGAPRGYYSPKYQTVPMFQGIFNGHDDHWSGGGAVMATFSIRIAPGNSGSGIFNKRGQLIGVIHSHMVIFDEISWGTTYQDTKEFIKTYSALKGRIL